MNATEKIEKLLRVERMHETAPLIEKAFHALQQNAEASKQVLLVESSVAICELSVNELSLGSDSTLAILLLPIAKAKEITPDQCSTTYGSAVSQLVSDLLKIEKLDRSKYSSNAENFIKLLLTLSNDIRVVLITLATNVQHMRSLQLFSDEEQKRIAGEAKFLYLPITHRLGLYKIKKELEDKIMAFFEPDTYQMLQQKLVETQADRDVYIEEFIAPIKLLLEDQGFDCSVFGRVKSIPSIWKKMSTQKVDFERVYDLFAIRIILNKTIENDKADCWKIYSLVTNIYSPNPRRLRDWITHPKTTGYESLHTTAIGPAGKWVEVQIRTKRMDEVAENGFAAHWKYKSNYNKATQTDWFESIRSLLEKTDAGNLEKNISKDKKALYSDEIFIFTPKGDLRKLRIGHTVLDFAYEIHTDVGSSCTGAIVNNKIVPLKHELSNGDTVKILTSKTQKPNHSWLDYVKGTKALNKIKQSLRIEEYKDAEHGKEQIKAKLMQLDLSFEHGIIDKLVEQFKCESHLDLYQQIGDGTIDLQRLKKALTTEDDKTNNSVPTEYIPDESIGEHMAGIHAGKKDFLIIDNSLDAIHYQFARCCNPIPGDKIFAFVSVTQGIKIHKTSCSNAKDMIIRFPYRILEARWKESSQSTNFTAHLKIEGKYSNDVVNKLTQLLTHELKIIIRSIQITPSSNNQYVGEVGILVSSNDHLEKIINRLQRNKDIHTIERLK